MAGGGIGGLLRRVFRRAMDVNTPSQEVQIESLADEPHSDVEVLGVYGVEAVPPDEVDEGLGCFVGGESDHGVVLGWFDKLYRPKGLHAGEVAFYSKFGQTMLFDRLGQVVITDQAGSKIAMQANGDIVHVPASGVMRVIGSLNVSDGIHANGVISTNTSITSAGDVTAGGLSMQGHVHGGVQHGSDDSAGPH